MPAPLGLSVGWNQVENPAARSASLSSVAMSVSAPVKLMKKSRVSGRGRHSLRCADQACPGPATQPEIRSPGAPTPFRDMPGEAVLACFYDRNAVCQAARDKPPRACRGGALLEETGGGPWPAPSPTQREPTPGGSTFTNTGGVGSPVDRISRPAYPEHVDLAHVAVFRRDLADERIQLTGASTMPDRNYSKCSPNYDRRNVL